MLFDDESLRSKSDIPQKLERNPEVKVDNFNAKTTFKTMDKQGYQVSMQTKQRDI